LRQLYTTQEIADLKGCTVANVNRIIYAHADILAKHINIYGGRKLLDETGKTFILLMTSKRGRPAHDKHGTGKR